jgi:transposase
MGRRRLEVPEASLSEIERTLAKEKDARVARWLLGVRLVCLKRSPEEAGMEIGVSAREVRRWVNRFNAGGIEAMRPNWSPGRSPKLTSEQLEEFRIRIRTGPTKDDAFSSWRGHFVRDVLRDEFGVSYKLTGVYKLLHRLGFSALMPRPRHPGSSDEEREEFKKNLAAGVFGGLRQRCPKAGGDMVSGRGALRSARNADPGVGRAWKQASRLPSD